MSAPYPPEEPVFRWKRRRGVIVAAGVFFVLALLLTYAAFANSKTTDWSLAGSIIVVLCGIGIVILRLNPYDCEFYESHMRIQRSRGGPTMDLPYSSVARTRVAGTRGGRMFEFWIAREGYPRRIRISGRDLRNRKTGIRLSDWLEQRKREVN